MKIAHINLSDSTGGASIAALRLHRAMLDSGMDSTLFVVRQTIFNDPTIVGVSDFERKYLANARYLYTRYLSRNSLKSRGLFSADFGSSSVVEAKNFEQFDVIYLHWINHGMMSLEALDKILALGKPVYWVCHDMWPLTGGCHHSFECEKYMSGCLKCPSLHRGRRHVAQEQFALKRRVYSRHNQLSFIAISPYMEQSIGYSMLTENHRCFTIPNTLDMEIFSPQDMAKSRKRFSLPQDKLLVLFGADNGVKNPYKGWEYAQLAIEKFARHHNSEVEIVIFGSEYNAELAKSVAVPVRFVGKISDPSDMAKLYSAVDIYINPSIAESLSYTTMEACSCSTTVVAFATGGIPSILNHRQTGYLVEVGDIEGLVEGMEWAVAANSKELAKSCRDSIKGKFDTNTIISLHKNMLSTVE